MNGAGLELKCGRCPSARFAAGACPGGFAPSDMDATVPIAIPGLVRRSMSTVSVLSDSPWRGAALARPKSRTLVPREVVYVSRLNVAMDDAPGVRGSQRDLVPFFFAFGQPYTN